MLATSRAPLRLSGEHVLPLEPLSVDDAATLFVELAAARGVVLHADTLASVHEICRRLDGLAAGDRARGGPPRRPPTGRDPAGARRGPRARDGRARRPAGAATNAARGDRLELRAPERAPARAARRARGFRRRRRARRRARIAERRPEFLPDLEALVAWSLVRSDVTDGEVRLSMLETVREHALDRLRAERRTRRPAATARRAIPRARPRRRGRARRAGSGSWLDRLEARIRQHPSRPRLVLRLGSRRGCAARDLGAQPLLAGARPRQRGPPLARPGPRPGDDVPDDVRADALWTAARQAAAQSDWAEALPLLEAGAIRAARAPRARGRLRAGGARLDRASNTRPERAEELCEEALEVAPSSGRPRDRRSAEALADVFSAERRARPCAGITRRRSSSAARSATPSSLPTRRTTSVLRFRERRDRAGAPGLRGVACARARPGRSPYIAAAQFMLAELDLLAGDVETRRADAREASRSTPRSRTTASSGVSRRARWPPPSRRDHSKRPRGSSAQRRRSRRRAPDESSDRARALRAACSKHVSERTREPRFGRRATLGSENAPAELGRLFRRDS